MSEKPILADSEVLASVVKQLSKCPDVLKFDSGEEKEAWELAHCFDELEGYFRSFLEKQLPRLAKENLTSEEVCALLYEIGTGLHQILYHIRRPRFYRYLEPS